MKPDDNPKKDPQKQVRVPLHPALEIIEEAIKRGDFDNLPGKGKPLNLNPKEVSDPTGIANGIRRNANLSTPWEMLRQEIDTAIDRAERELKAAHTQRKAALQRPKADATVTEERWQASVAGFEKHATEINSKILTYNLMIPRHLPHLHKPRLQFEEILARLGAGQM